MKRRTSFQQWAITGSLSVLVNFGSLQGFALDYTFLQATPLPATPLSTGQMHPDQTADEITPFERSQWQLSDPEWQRYRLLMQGIRGSISPKSLSPIEVLGIHAETAQERKQYAKRWAKLMHEDVERTLAFQREYVAAAQELYGQQSLLDTAKLSAVTASAKTSTTAVTPTSQAGHAALLDGDRLLVFLKVSGCLQCTVVAEKLLAMTATQKTQVDLYFTDTHEGADDAKIIAWAQQHQLDPKRLAHKTLTLNHDKGVYAQVSRRILADVPAVYVLRHNQLFQWSVAG